MASQKYCPEIEHEEMELIVSILEKELEEVNSFWNVRTKDKTEYQIKVENLLDKFSSFLM